MSETLRFTVRRKETDLVFHGALLADVSSKVEGQPRWYEARIYRTRLGQFVLEQVGASIVEGEQQQYFGVCVSREVDVPEAARLFFHVKVARKVVAAAGMTWPFEEIQ
jgi:hypothetical protein